jgi:RNA recognition motif-containing protein
MSINLYVGNLSYQTTESGLRDLFATYGEVISAKIIMDRDSGRSKGFSFVEMANRADGERAMAELNGREVDQRPLKVNEAKPRTNNRGSEGGFGGGHRNYDRY